VHRARFGAGAFVISGCDATDQATVRERLAEFSDKKVYSSDTVRPGPMGSAGALVSVR
jgi:hypothetical protein